MTVGTVVPIMNAVRAADGSAAIVSVLRSVPVEAFEVSTSADCPVTVIVSSSVPTSSVMSSVRNCCVPIRRSVCTKVLNPVSVALMV